MKNLLRIIVPEKTEAILYLCMSASLLAIQSIKPIKTIIETSSEVTTVSTEAYSSPVSVWVNNLLGNIDGRIIDFLVWVLVGSLVMIMLSVIIASIKTASDEVHFITYYHSPQGKHHEINVLLTKTALRLFGFSALIIWLYVLLSYLNETLTSIFYTSLVNIKHPISWLWLCLAVVVYAFSLYSITILIRITTLKVRVFSNQE
jgi:hypothetical protein